LNFKVKLEINAEIWNILSSHPLRHNACAWSYTTFNNNNYDSRRGIHPEDGGSKVLRNVGIMPHPYTGSQPRKLRFDSSLT